MPKVSVIVPTYQRREYLEDALKSVFDQTFKDFEIIIVDNGSTDGTDILVQQFEESFGKINYMLETQAKGPAVARNVALRHAQGDYVAFLDSDDIWLPNKLELQAAHLDNNPDVGLVHGNMSYFGDKKYMLTAFQANPPKSGHIYTDLFIVDFVHTSTVMMRLSCVAQIGYFNESYLICEDHDYWLRAARSLKIGHVDTVVTRYRVHSGGISREKALLLVKNLIHIQEEHLRESPWLKQKLSPAQMHRAYYGLFPRLAGTSLQQSDFAAARRAMLKYLRLYPKGILQFGALKKLVAALVPNPIGRLLVSLKQNTEKALEQKEKA